MITQTLVSLIKTDLFMTETIFSLGCLMKASGSRSIQYLLLNQLIQGFSIWFSFREHTHSGMDGISLNSAN